MKQFDNDRDQMLLRARDAGLEALITIGSDFQSNVEALDLSHSHDFIYASVGIHPHDAKDFTDDIYDQLKKWTDDDKVVAVGETGLDYHYDNSPREVQRAVFMQHLQLANDTALPAVIHSRDAKEDTMDILNDSGITKGVLHCFSGDWDMAEKAMMMGLHISIAGPVTFKKAVSLQEIVKLIPDEYLLIETDAPYLTPVPHRGKRNEPSYVVHTAQAVAELRGVTIDDIARITSLNARRLFNIGEVAATGEIAYKIRNSLYLNITNRCTNRCSFCIRMQSDFVKGHNLRLSREPSAAELKHAIGDPTKYKEVVFCGYGEPLLRLDIVKEIGEWVKANGGHVRINTNGHANLIHKRNILPELRHFVDSMSISLDAQDAETYAKLCIPIYNDAYHGVIEFIDEAKKYIPSVQITVVDAESVDLNECKKIAEKAGVGFRVRKLDVVG
jgi:TatD DNase family protein